MSVTPEDRIHALGIWQGPVEIEPITGGITNRNYLVRDRSTRRVVRLGDELVPVFFFFLFFQRLLIEGIATTGMKR